LSAAAAGQPRWMLRCFAAAFSHPPTVAPAHSLSADTEHAVKVSVQKPVSNIKIWLITKAIKFKVLSLSPITED